MAWNDLASNQTISINNLLDGINTGLLSRKAISIPGDTKQITKSEANTYLNLDNSDSFTPFALKSTNQLVVKSNIIPAPSVSVVFSPDSYYTGIANNKVFDLVTNPGPIQLISRWNSGGNGFVLRSTDFGLTYTSVVTINDRLYGIKFLQDFRHPSYLSVEPFIAVGQSGRIITNSVGNASSWITISSPTTQNLYDVAFNSSVGIIVGDRRIIRTNTNNRINSWSIVNSVASLWRAVASDSFNFIAVGDNSAIITSNALGSTWTVRSMPPLTPSKQLRGITYHSDGYWYAVGYDTANPLIPYMMRSNNTGVTWENYSPLGDEFYGALYSIISINDRLIIGGQNHQYQIINNTLIRYTAWVSSNVRNYQWVAAVKNANSNGFDMAGNFTFEEVDYPVYSNF